MSTPANLTVLGILSASVVFIAGLIWNDAIQSLIVRLFPNEQIVSSTSPSTVNRPSTRAIWIQFAFALGFTIFAVILVLGLAHFFQKLVPHSKFHPILI